MNLLLLSNSTMPAQPYLEWPRDLISGFLGNIKRAVFVPYAAVSFSYDRYEEMVAQALGMAGIEVRSVHRHGNPREAVRNAEAILVGGGNTFHLLHQLYELELVDEIRGRVKQGVPYIGWSAGSNVACPTIKTTNDMPVIEPRSFEALSLVPFQINPHYTELTIAGHGGESRLQRLTEYTAINEVPVVCLPEGCAIRVHGTDMNLVSPEPIKLLRKGGNISMLEPGPVSIA